MKGNSKILVVDDDMEMGKALQLFLMKKGFDVHPAKDATEACILFSMNNYDLVITDILMPGISGLKMIRMLQQISSDFEFIVITGFDSSENRDEANALGVRGYFVKPFETDKLLELIERTVPETRETKC